ncbi:HalOD1 output domain-containing protein [Haloterrigena alkaliphila]|uniref:Halobacterial output domain-containing protein n=1 Tax=Haloterrigena alkaliphila TaxID=2816475 RepID=A0A8A2VCS3_9EURY|nr:HalOD1 output domain-containing protein [Haloterrigena alkaliphila]QSW98015.1 hypothetical protein J0X25_11375 [Haloterrigena alkaliphila]
MSEAARDELVPISDVGTRPVYHDEARGTYHARYETTDYEPVTALIEAVSSVLGVDPDTLERPAERIDPDALNAIAVHWSERETRRGAVTFLYADCTVTMRADGEIVVDPDVPVESSTGR